jgi:coniferyl-aldehyde dehydrogenase
LSLPPPEELAATLVRLRAAWRAAKPDLRQRTNDLARLRGTLAQRLPEMAGAISADFGHRSRHETLLADGMAVLNDIDHLRHAVPRWTKRRRVGVGWRFWPAHAEVRAEALGVVGVISPWNYPVNLALVPLATAIAAGNHVYLKPSEHTPRTAAFLQQLLADVFPPDRVAVACGDEELAAAFAALAFDHLVFTGSTAVGRKVMAAAAPNLTPLTLELGGKSPALVCADYPLAKAAQRIASGKWFNAGQTCIAPDYVMIDAGREADLVRCFEAEVGRRYGDLGGESAGAEDFTRIVNERQYRRLRALLDDARSRGCRVIELAQIAPDRAERERLLPPTLVLDAGDDARLMQEEIFGPILPIKSYKSLDEAIAYVAGRDRPLALYPFSDNRRRIEQILYATLAGGVTVNDTLFHFAAPRLPFGGVGPSGVGAYHGRAGFDAMTKALPVMWQAKRAGTDLLKPPYAKVARLLSLLVR